MVAITFLGWLCLCIGLGSLLAEAIFKISPKPARPEKEDHNVETAKASHKERDFTNFKCRHARGKIPCYVVGWDWKK